MARKMIINFNINTTQIQAEVDTGCPIILIGSKLYRQHFSATRLLQLNRPLYDASGNKISLLGSFQAKINKNNKSGYADVVVQASERKLSLIGTEGLDILFPGWQRTFEVNHVSNLENKILNLITSRYKNLIDSDALDAIKGFEIDLPLKDGAIPVFAGARPIPYALMPQVEVMLKEMVCKRILCPVKTSSWASPIVLVKKPNGALRLCIDPKRTLNPALREDHYPLPRVDDLLAGLGGHAYYSQLDLSGAFQQLKLSKESQDLVVINTPFGLFSFERLPFGIKTASAVFQRTMDQIFKDFSWVKIYVDDIIIGADSHDQMMDRLEIVLSKLSEHNVKINLKKCLFVRSEVRFLGHIVSRDGVRPCPDRLRTIKDCPAPRNVKELQAFLGMVTYCHRFVGRLSDKLHVLFPLLKNGVKFEWTLERQKAFDRVKEDLCVGKLLEHFDPSKDVVICCDASDVGISAVLCHEIDGVLKPIAFHSRVLSPAESRYPILHRELLAVVFATEKYYKYIFARRVKLYTDHKPLVPMIKAGLTLVTTSTRIQRYLFRLNPFDLDVHYKPGKLNSLADFPSRFPTPHIRRSEEDLLEEKRATTVNLVEDNQMINLEKIRTHTASDKILSGLARALVNDLDLCKDPDLKGFVPIKQHLNYSDGILTFDGRTLIPSSLHDQILNVLHDGHIGIVKMKQMSRRYFYWLGLNKSIENMVKNCATCKSFNPDRLPKFFVPWPSPTKPFERVHIDFFYFDSRTFLILVDAFSRWVEIHLMSGTDAHQVIGVLKRVFATFGDPVTLVCDNGPPFQSFEFQEFCRLSNIKLLHSPPYHPQSNGLAERWVQTVKTHLKKSLERGYTDGVLQQVLSTLRNTPSTDDTIPSQLILSYQPRTLLEKTVEGRQIFGETNLELPAYRHFVTGETVFLKGEDNHTKRTLAVVVRPLGDVMYELNVQGKLRTAHANQLIKSNSNPADDMGDSSASSRPRRKRNPPNRYNP